MNSPRSDAIFSAVFSFRAAAPIRANSAIFRASTAGFRALKRRHQVVAELDKLLACGVNGSVYFVDDNFIANRRALRDLLPHLIQWQKRNGYAVSLSCEATLNIARSPEILALMREAAFDTIFCGIETPEPEALKAIDKAHNLMVPILDAVRTINRHGMEVVSGIILGLDTDTKDSGTRILDFLEQSKIPMATINLLQALPRTPLWDRLQQENRLLRDEDLERESNVEFKLPYNDVLAMWRTCMDQGLPAGHFVRPLRIPDARDTAQSLEAAEKPSAFVAAQHRQGSRDPRAGSSGSSGFAATTGAPFGSSPCAACCAVRSSRS